MNDDKCLIDLAHKVRKQSRDVLAIDLAIAVQDYLAAHAVTLHKPAVTLHEPKPTDVTLQCPDCARTREGTKRRVAKHRARKAKGGAH